LREPNNDYYVSGVAAERGFGPFIYELAMMHLNKENKGLMPTRDGDVRGDAWNVWERFFKTRPDVEKRTLELLDPGFNFNIIDDYYWDSDEEKIEDYSVLSPENKESLAVFNTAYLMKPTEEYYKLIDIANKWVEKGFDKQKAADAGEALWDEKYD